MRVTRPCLTASSASSRGVQAVTGRANCAGGWQARLITWMICSAVKVAGVPGRGASAKAAAMASSRAGRSASATDRGVAAAAQRDRHLRAVFGVQPTCRASGSLRRPVAAPRTIRTRSASACGQDDRRSSAVSTACWAGETVMGSGAGPGDIAPPGEQPPQRQRHATALFSHNPSGTSATLYYGSLLGAAWAVLMGREEVPP